MLKEKKKRTTTIGNEFREFNLLMKSIPSIVVVFYCVSVILMNLLANKEIYTGTTWIALDCGFIVSWIAFLTMDMLTKRFGPKASVEVSISEISTNLLVYGVFSIVSLVPGNWSQFYTYNIPEINNALDSTIGISWYVLLGSSVAMLISSIVNALLNYSIGKLFSENNFTEFAARSYISTMVAQFVDNLVFAGLVSHVFFGWSTAQCIICSIIGALFELVCEIVFSPIGYVVSKKWASQHVGQAYINYMEDHK